MDDLQEKETGDLKNVGQYCFVSCWTENSEEQIPMWKMYGNLESGVRIKMRKCPFMEKEVNKSELEQIVGDKVKDETNGNSIRMLVPIMDILKMRITPPGLIKQNDILFAVEYTTEKSKLYPRIFKQEGQGVSIDFDKVGKYKNTGWSFQKEWRYRLLLFPINLFDVNNAEKQIAQMLGNVIVGKSVMPFSFYDVEIDNEAYSKMEIMLSPKISAGNRVIVENLVEKYNPSAKIVESAYKGLIS